MSNTLGAMQIGADRVDQEPSSGAAYGACFRLKGRDCVVLLESEADAALGSASGRREVLGELRIDGEAYLIVARRETGPDVTGESEPSAAELLTPRELQIAMYVAKGLCDKRIAREIKVSPFTVRAHMRRAFAKLGVSTRAAMVARVMQTSY
jgi:DNA-binding NarL/FixJ family response regulator